MKKNRKYIIIIFIALLVITISYSVYSFFDSNKNMNSIENDRILAEIKYFESKFINLFNSLNNIEYENYRIYSSKINSSTQQESKSSSSSSNNNSSSEENTQMSSPQNNENINKYNLELEGVLTNKQNINWNYIKNEIELLYTSIPTITLDLYQINLNKNDILNFNSSFDLLTIEVNNENKENTLKQLSNLYAYLPKFLENTNVDNTYKTVIKTKAYIFKAYSILDSENWDEIGTNIDKAITIFKEELLGTQMQNEPKQYNINRCYIMLNELKNSVNQNNKEIFLIKYRNLLEEISNI